MISSCIFDIRAERTSLGAGPFAPLQDQLVTGTWSLLIKPKPDDGPSYAASPTSGCKVHQRLAFALWHLESKPTLARFTCVDHAVQLWLWLRKWSLVSQTICGVSSELSYLSRHEFEPLGPWGPSRKLKLHAGKNILRAGDCRRVGRARRFDELPRLVSAHNFENGDLGVTRFTRRRGYVFAAGLLTTQHRSVYTHCNRCRTERRTA